MNGTQAYAVSKKYTDNSILGISGVLAGKNCTIESIVPIEGGNRVTYKWTADDETVRTSTLDVMDGEQGDKGDKGDKGNKGDKGDPGTDGEDGVGIVSIEKTSTVGNVDTYTITLSDGSTYDFTVTNGSGGSGSLTSLLYEFTNDNSADGNGTIHLFSADPTILGNVDIMWGDANGIMSNYSPINTIDVTLTYADKVSYNHFNTYNAIPKYATKVLAVKNNAIVAEYALPANKLWDATVFGQHQYSVGILSDIHYQYDTADTDFATACDYLDERESVIAVCVAGDLTDNGTQTSLDQWKTARNTHATNTPVYSCSGNHESYRDNSYMVTNPTNMRQYLDSGYTNETEPYYYKTIGNDIYAFVSIYEGVRAAKGNTMFSAACLAWLENLLETYRNQRVFLFAHVPPHQSLVPSGFWNGNGAYSLDLWGSGSGMLADRTAFLNLLKHYKNVIWFGGHSHIKYNYQETWANLNMARLNTDGAQMVHVSSLTVPRDIINGSASDYIYAESEGAVMDVYPNHVIIRNRNFVGGKFIGVAQYIINTTPVVIPPSTKTLVSISATKAQTTYNEGDTLSTADITVTATYDDTSTAVVVGTYDTTQVDMSTEGTYSIGVSYTENGVTATTSVSVTVVASGTKALASISATKTVTSYTVGDTLSTADIVTTATYTDSTTATVQGVYDISGVDMSVAGSYSIGVSYTEDGVTQTTSIAITVSGGGTDVPVAFTMTDGIKIDTTTGAESSGAKYSASDYLPVVSGAVYSLSDTPVTSDVPSFRICYYNGTSASDFISATENITNGTEKSSGTFTPPSGATYFRLRAYHNNNSTGITSVHNAMLTYSL